MEGIPLLEVKLQDKECIEAAGLRLLGDTRLNGSSDQALAACWPSSHILPSLKNSLVSWMELEKNWGGRRSHRALLRGGRGIQGGLKCSNWTEPAVEVAWSWFHTCLMESWSIGPGCYCMNVAAWGMYHLPHGVLAKVGGEQCAALLPLLSRV